MQSLCSLQDGDLGSFQRPSEKSDIYIYRDMYKYARMYKYIIVLYIYICVVYIFDMDVTSLTTDRLEVIVVAGLVETAFAVIQAADGANTPSMLSCHEKFMGGW